MLRYAQLVLGKAVKESGDIMMDALAHSNNDQLIGLAGSTGSKDEREVALRFYFTFQVRKTHIKFISKLADGAIATRFYGGRSTV